MAQNYCIPKEYITKLKTSIKSLSENNQLAKLADMSTEDRVDFFKKTLSETDSIRLNDEFEKAIGQKKLTALRDWVQKNIDEKYRADETIFLMKRYKNLDEVNNFIETRLELMAEQKAGIALTDDQVKKFTELGKKFYEESVKIGDNLGSIAHQQENIEWGKAYKALAEYREELMPRNWWQTLVNNFGRSNMLLSIKSPFLNIESNTINAITEAITRRIENGRVHHKVSRDLIKEYRQFSRKMFHETGVDFTRMLNLDDTVTGVGKVWGEESQRFGAGKVGGALNSYTDFVFNKLLSTPDVEFASVAFADSLALNATRLAKGNAEEAAKMFRAATNVNAQGDAKMLREIALSDARYATYTNESASSKISQKMREILNKAGGLGDVLMPFVKTVGNVAELGADYAGLGLVKGGFGVGKSMIKNGKVSREAMRDAMRNVARSGVGMTAAYLLASQVEVDDFVGVYDPERVKIDQLANTAYNAVLIDTPMGKRWVNVDYLGPLAAPFVAMMYAKKYGNEHYISGATSDYLARLPFTDAKTVFESLDTLSDPSNVNAIGRLVEGIPGKIGDTIASRLVPGIMYDIARATDDVQRDTRQSKFVIDTPFYDINLDSFVQKLPFIRHELPKKHDALGRVMLESSPVESMLFGSRVKTAREDQITEEILRLRNTGHTPNVKDIRFMYSSNVDKLKEKLGEEKFIEAAIQLGKDTAKKYDSIVHSSSYKRASDEDKKKMLDDASTDAYQALLKRNGI